MDGVQFSDRVTKRLSCFRGTRLILVGGQRGQTGIMRLNEHLTPVFPSRLPQESTPHTHTTLCVSSFMSLLCFLCCLRSSNIYCNSETFIFILSSSCFVSSVTFHLKDQFTVNAAERQFMILLDLCVTQHHRSQSCIKDRNEY